MTTITFTPPIPPSPGTKSKPEVKVLEASFGDGYTQTAGDGINNIREILTLNWEHLLPTQADQLENFFVERAGYKYFYYQASHRYSPRLYLCKEWDRGTIQGGFATFTATLRQSFAFV